MPPFLECGVQAPLYTAHETEHLFGYRQLTMYDYINYAISSFGVTTFKGTHDDIKTTIVLDIQDGRVIEYVKRP